MDKTQNFINRAKIVHQGENLDYSKVVYINNRTPVIIIDHDLKPDGTEYGEFKQTPYNHLRGQCHPLKRSQRISTTKSSKQDDIIRRFKEVHKDENLDYSEVVYKNMHTKVKIISHDIRPDGTEYGAFWQEPVVHLKGCSHPDIARDRQIKRMSSNAKDFKEKAEQVHIGKNYDFSKVEYVNNRTKVKIACPKHGVFEISPDNFLAGKGCPKCGNHLSHGEDEIIEFIKSFYNGEVRQGDHLILGGNKEIDIYLPSKKIGFEFNGLRWHSELFGKDRNYHLNKLNECKDCGIKLFHIFEDEYLYHRNPLFSKIKQILGYNTDLPKIGARKCIVKEIDKDKAKTFIDSNHIQGFASATIYAGGFYGDELVGVMCFKKEINTTWNLVRSCNSIKYTVQGLTSKIFKWFVDKYEPMEVKTFLDRRWEDDAEDNVYTKCGFVLTETLKPDYRYTNGHGKRLHKFGFRKQKLHKKYNLPLSMTEYEMTQKIGYYRIWDCGLLKYVWINPKREKV